MSYCQTLLTVARPAHIKDVKDEFNDLPDDDNNHSSSDDDEDTEKSDIRAHRYKIEQMFADKSRHLDSRRVVVGCFWQVSLSLLLHWVLRFVVGGRCF